MNTIIILCGFLTLQNCNQTKNEQNTESINAVAYHKTETKNSVLHDSILNNIQIKITNASYDGFTKSNTQKLDALESILENSKTSNKDLTNYWIAYINYYKTFIAMKLKDKDLDSKSNKKGIQILTSNKNKNSDDYALLALLKALSYSYVSGMEAPAISKEINVLLKKGIEADDKNFRIYYAQGSLDFHTPKEFGGGKIAENALLKAINLPEKNTDNQLPTWGKEESYDLIIRFYLSEKQKDKAKTYFDKAKVLFPNSYTIKMYQSNF